MYLFGFRVRVDPNPILAFENGMCALFIRMYRSNLHPDPYLYRMHICRERERGRRL